MGSQSKMEDNHAVAASEINLLSEPITKATLPQFEQYSTQQQFHADALFQDPDLERAILGCAMLPNSPAARIVAERLDIAALLPVHQIVANVIVDLVRQEKACDVISVVAELRLRNQLNAVGGKIAVAFLYDMQACSHNVSTYIALVHELYRRRRMRTMFEECILALDNGSDPREMIHRLSALSRGDGDE